MAQVLKSLIIIFLCVLVPEILSAQIKFDIKVSDKHQKKLERSKDARKKLKSYKAYYTKDSIKAAKKAWKTFRKDYKDSLKVRHLWKEAKTNKGRIMSNQWTPYVEAFDFNHPDSMKMGMPKDSLDVALRTLMQQDNFKELQLIYEGYTQYDSAYLDRFKTDSVRIVDEELEKRFKLKKRIASYLPAELAKASDFKTEKALESGMIDSFGNVKKADRSGVKKFFKNVSPEQFSKSQLSLKSAKEKFASVPSLEKKEEGIKRKSLEAKPWKKRVYLGGNFTIRSTDPIILDANIRPGYKFNKTLSAGVGLILREQFGSSQSNLTGDAHGFLVFANYDILKSCFLYAEYQIIRNRSIFKESEKQSSWQTAYLLGAGRTFQLNKTISASISLLYDFNHRQNELNARPFEVRFGYKVAF